MLDSVAYRQQAMPGLSVAYRQEGALPNLCGLSPRGDSPGRCGLSPRVGALHITDGISRGLALKPGTISGKEGFLSLSLDATAAALALSIVPWSAKSTGGA